MSVYKTKSDDGCETTNVDFGSGKIGIGINDKYGCGTMHVVLFKLDNAHPLGEVCRNEDEAWKNCTNCVSLNFPTKEAIDNFINVLTDYKKEQFA